MKRCLLVLLIAAGCSRELRQGAVPTVAARAQPGKSVIFVGLDGADWRLLDRFVADGTMPHLAKILDSAERRVLNSQHPPLSPLVWTSMMTGVSPLEHRILDFTRFNPQTRQQEPITSDERAVPAIWNMATYGGKRVAVFGLWATCPAEPGIEMTDRDVPRDYVAATEEIHRRALHFLREEKPDLTIVYFQGADEIGHFTSGNVEKAQDYFRRIDSILEDYRTLASDTGAELVIASDHGFDWGGSHDESATATATAAKWHRREGVFLHWPATKAELAPANVDQICATLLQMLGLPPAEGIAEAIGGSKGESLNYRRMFHRTPSANAGDSRLAAEQVEKLRSLGYLASASTAPAGSSTTRTPQSFNNEGLIFLEMNRADDAERVFRQALDMDPSYSSPRRNLDDLLSERGVERLRAGDCEGAAADFRDVATESAILWAARSAAAGCLGHEDEARTAARKSLELDPDQPALRAMLGGG